MRGYSYNYIQRLQELAKESPKGSAIRLGVIAVKRNISIVSISNCLGVSRMAVYDWFAGKYNPKPEQYELLKNYINSNP
jgi:hypothetical protein